MTPVGHRFIGITDHGYREQSQAGLYALQQIGGKRTPEPPAAIKSSKLAQLDLSFIRAAEQQKNEARAQ